MNIISFKETGKPAAAGSGFFPTIIGVSRRSGNTQYLRIFEPVVLLVERFISA